MPEIPSAAKRALRRARGGERPKNTFRDQLKAEEVAEEQRKAALSPDERLYEDAMGMRGLGNYESSLSEFVIADRRLHLVSARESTSKSIQHLHFFAPGFTEDPDSWLFMSHIRNTKIPEIFYISGVSKAYGIPWEPAVVRPGIEVLSQALEAEGFPREEVTDAFLYVTLVTSVGTNRARAATPGMYEFAVKHTARALACEEAKAEAAASRVKKKLEASDINETQKRYGECIVAVSRLAVDMTPKHVMSILSMHDGRRETLVYCSSEYLPAFQKFNPGD